MDVDNWEEIYGKEDPWATLYVFLRFVTWKGNQGDHLEWRFIDCTSQPTL